MKNLSTHFLRFTLFVMALLALAVYIFALPAIYNGGSAEFPMASWSLLLIISGMYAAAVPFFMVLWQAFKLLGYIDQDQAFSELSVKALRNIKHYSTIVAILGIASVPLLFPIADADDAPGLILIGAAIAGIPVVFAVFAAILERLVKTVINIQTK